jgi:transcriptional regulator with PAS, ATPase and Fis domain
MAITEQEKKHWKVDAFVGKSPQFLHTLDQIRRLQKVDKTNVLILGESGTGKELVARAIHYGSARVKAPFITVNCSAIPNDLADSAFFGHIKGSFTGALNNSQGYFEAADGGTLFLDELGDMPLIMQTKLLRALEEHTITRIGEHKEIKINVRVIAATNSLLEQRIQDKTFRQDLYYRLTGYTIKLPALRERQQDIDLLVKHFLELLTQEMNFVKGLISTEALCLLQSYHFPGNVRELRNIIEHALISSNGQPIQTQHLHLIHPSTDNVSVQSLSPQHIINKPNGQNSVNNEQKVLHYLKQYQKINNTQCQELLVISHHQASYLLKKMKNNNLLARKGERRWSFYQLT